MIEIPAGRHALDRVLTLRANGVTIRGAGSDKSILSFKNEISGPEGMLVYASDFTIEHVAIEDNRDDGLKINDGENITIRDVRVEWTGGPKTTNGAYSIAPVKSKNVLIRGFCFVRRLRCGHLCGPVAKRDRAAQSRREKCCGHRNRKHHRR